MIFEMTTNSDAGGSAGIYELWAWAELNRQKLAILAVALTVIGGAVYVYRYLAAEKEMAANQAILELRPTPSASTNPPALSPSAFLKVAADYPGTGAAERALLLAAGAMFSEGRYGEAQTRFEKFAHDYPESIWASSAAYGVASCLEAQNKRDEALTAYQNVVARYANDFIVTDTKFALARLFEAQKQPDPALKIYEEISRPAAKNPRASDALMRKEHLVKQYPELAKAAVLPAVTAAVSSAVTNLLKVSGSNVTVQVTTNRATTNAPAKNP